MQIDWQIASLSDWKADAIILFFYEDPSEPLPGVQKWLAEQGSWLKDSFALKDFKGKHQQIATFYSPPGQARIPRVLCVGVGPSEKLNPDKIRSATASALRKCRELKLERPGIPLSSFHDLPFDAGTALEEALTGGMTGLYKHQGQKTRDVEEEDYPQTLLIFSEEEPAEALAEIPARASAIASGVYLARNLTAAPANLVTPGYILKTAESLAQGYGFRLHAIDFDEARSMGMGAFTAVAQGSKEPAYMIVLEHAPEGSEEERPIVLIGKGITFDTGGISLKPGAKMEAMKQDMAGAAAVLGVFEILGKTKTKKRVVGILPCTENMPGGKAYKPGDVLRSLSGLTVEVISTDAEGRLVLSDALTYAQRYQPSAIIDIATLTGACIVALGYEAAGIMGNDDALIERIRDIGSRVGEKVWPLPLWDSYFDNLKSDVADFKNVGERTAGTIIGGIFLKQFVSDEIPWAHLDIAGTAWADKDAAATPKGASGFGVRLLFELVRS